MRADTLMGTANGTVAGTLAPLHNGDVLAGSRDATGNPVDPPRAIKRFLVAGTPGVDTDNDIITAGDAAPQAQQWQQFRQAVEGSHNSAHGYFGNGSNIKQAHQAFEDPFVFLLHANVDRLFAMWQTQPGQDWRLDPAQVYGAETGSGGSGGITATMQPWDGTSVPGIEPWTGASPAIEVKTSAHPSVVAPPCYDTLPLTVTQVAPTPGDPVRFVGIPEGQVTARAVRLRVRGCREVTATATVSGDPAFTLLSSSVASPHTDTFGTEDLLVWVLFAAGTAGQTANGAIDIHVDETGDDFSVPIEASVVAKPSVAACLVLDRSGSMDLPSGIPTLDRIDVLRSSAPLFVNLLDDQDGIGVVRFDTDAAVASGIQTAGPQIGGGGRNNALNAISTHTTNPAGMTAIGDGVELAATELAGAAGFDLPATVVFTDGHETEHKYISEVADLVDGRVFAVGLGTADQLNPGALNDLADGTGGYLLLTGNAGPDDQILLQKYFAQILAGVTNSAIVVDPDGFVPIGGTTSVPYQLTEAETRSDVIVLSPAADALTVVLEAPDGAMFDAASGATVLTSPDYQTVRLALAPPIQVAGGWRAHLKVDKRGLRAYLKRLEKNRQLDTVASVKQHGIPFTLSVQARTSLNLGVAVAAASRVPGTPFTVTATLTEAGIPLAAAASVTATITAPDGHVSTMGMAEVEAGRFRVEAPTAAAGVYRVLVHAEGHSLRGTRFTREELRTAAVWAKGDQRPEPPAATTDWCAVLSCWLHNDSVVEFLKGKGIDADTLRRCLDEHCG